MSAVIYNAETGRNGRRRVDAKPERANYKVKSQNAIKSGKSDKTKRNTNAPIMAPKRTAAQPNKQKTSKLDELFRI